ncbi:MAG: hypothetical protein V7723_04060 [Sneathiella sp.]|uniref:hypothetical protein n=1 Tax=Sneathiella sp. TaxID=1964365 RepID=UPI003001370F
MDQYVFGLVSAVFGIANGMLLLLSFVERPAFGLIRDVNNPRVNDKSTHRILEDIQRFNSYRGPTIMAILVNAGFFLSLYQCYLRKYDIFSLLNVGIIVLFLVFSATFGREALRQASQVSFTGGIAPVRAVLRKVILLHHIGWIFVLVILVLQFSVTIPT